MHKPKLSGKFKKAAFISRTKWIFLQPIVGTVSGFPTAKRWRNVIMPAQPQVKPEEAKQLVNWILSLDKKHETGSVQ
jgi:hypothetical protein